MSDVEALEQKIDDHIDRQEKSNDKVEKALEKIAEHMATFIGFQSRAEERHLASNERLDKAEKSIEKLQDKVAILWDRVTKNSLIVNAAVAVVSAMTIWFLKDFLG